MTKKLIGILALTLCLSACDDYLDVNENPNGATAPPLKGLLANTSYNSAINVYNLGSTTSFYTQYLASPNEASATDIYERLDFSGSWGNIYGILSDLYDLDRFAAETNSIHYQGIAKVLTAMNLGLAVDVWGDLPYQQALSFETISPTYDSQEEVYDEIIALLDEAIALLSQENIGEALVGSSDFIHGGDVTAWIKTAHALKARYLNHLSETGSFDENAVRTALQNAYTSNDDDAALTQFQVRNPWAQVALNNAGLILGGWLSEQVIDHMNGTTYGVLDPRLPLITDPLPDGVTFRGTENGSGRIGDGTVQEECYLTTDGYYSSTNSPLFVITFAELKFIEAELEWRSGNLSVAYAAYLEGIEAHMEKMGVPAEEIALYLAAPQVAVGEGGLTLESIFKEKYIALFLHPESWVDVRRNNHNYQDFTVPVNNTLGGEFIARFDYPDTEYQRNRSNVPTVDLLTPLFWDAN